MFKKTIYILFTILLITLISYGYYWYGVNYSSDENGKDLLFGVSAGEGVGQIADNLKTQSLIKSDWLFKIYVWQSDLQEKLKAGEYMLNPGMPIKEIVTIIASGETAGREITITTIEGWNIQDIDNYLTERNITADNVFSRKAEAAPDSWQFDFAKPGFLENLPPGATLEGYLFPDTYRIFRDAGADDIIKKMLDNFGEKVTGQMREEINRQGKELHDVVIMASIIEKEVRTAEDMKIVSGIFWDRIEIGQALQSDATLSYFLGDKKARHTQAETKIDTPYNTYLYPGLPPGPISNPGLNAIKAAINPEMSEYNYFLNRQDTGETIFSKTFEEHINNKAKYLN